MDFFNWTKILGGESFTRQKFSEIYFCLWFCINSTSLGSRFYVLESFKLDKCGIFDLYFSYIFHQRDFWVYMMESKRFSKYNPKHIRFKFCEAFFRIIAIAINNNCYKQQFVEIIIRPKFVKFKKIFLAKFSPIKVYVAILCWKF